MRKRIIFTSLIITLLCLFFLCFYSSVIEYKKMNASFSEKYYLLSKSFERNHYDDSDLSDLCTDFGCIGISFYDNDRKMELSNIDDDYTINFNEIEVENNIILKIKEANFNNYVLYQYKINNGYIVIFDIEPTLINHFYKSFINNYLTFILIEVIIVFIASMISVNFIMEPVFEISYSSQKNNKISTKYSELRGIVDSLNNKNKEISLKIDEIEEEKNHAIKAKKSKDEFVANVSHEMNTPLTSIKGFAELLQSKTLSPEMQDKATSTIIKQAERLSNLISCIINYSELDSEDLPLYDVNISNIIQEELDTLDPMLKERKIKVFRNIDKDFIIMSRYERIIELLGNILRNAIKYNREEGTITITLLKANNSLVIEDTGIGIEKSNLDKIFDRFYTVDKSHNGKNGGFGLGLAVVKKICNISGWKLSVNSEINVGTVFIIKF